ncbi:hypothetical protein BKG80_18220 [Mycobacteroides chelonae]|uniref:hypothetical protein n=1 Tax=Mycobacteroides TaxID=670516 RepID=UPI000713BB3A|nr:MULTISPECIES: hypothetical protein [Mycobacteroides]KRQ17794.1 hypothetical protein AOT86_25825 [Mycobacteroides sp. H072]KRQ29605.1 hypothetical protein AOT84_25210 [Mycobacteroides sp. H002]KRQ44740.1 hypothetical protein AOT85_25740 [Mycobacteroides sp. H054]KRQ68954.1 hypothetical protein AOT83_17190 [Mycobacteroides sp. H001]MBF9351926.1 hypothetical protein [Mycobacteroides chelonae]
MVAMGYALIALAVIAVIFSIAFIRRPDETWDIYESWKWQDPEANRPSPAALRLHGAGGLVVALLSAGFGLWLITTYG